MTNEDLEALVLGDPTTRLIVRELLKGASNKSVARLTDSPEGTVKWRIHRLYCAFDVQTRAQFVAKIHTSFRGLVGQLSLDEEVATRRPPKF